MNTFLFFSGLFCLLAGVVILVVYAAAIDNGAIIPRNRAFIYIFVSVSFLFGGVLNIANFTFEGSLRTKCSVKGKSTQRYHRGYYYYTYIDKNGCKKEYEEIFIKGAWHRVTKKVTEYDEVSSKKIKK